jgi:hypothetical protein
MREERSQEREGKDERGKRWGKEGEGEGEGEGWKGWRGGKREVT